MITFITAHSTGPEYTTAEWARRHPRIRKFLGIHERSCGRVTCGGVFKCRGRTSCGRYVGWCLGGSDDNRCADCWVRHQRKLKKARAG